MGERAWLSSLERKENEYTFGESLRGQSVRWTRCRRASSIDVGMDGGVLNISDVIWMSLLHHNIHHRVLVIQYIYERDSSH